MILLIIFIFIVLVVLGILLFLKGSIDDYDKEEEDKAQTKWLKEHGK